jgi:hypothetical protein
MKEDYKIYVSYSYKTPYGTSGYGYAIVQPEIGWNGDTFDGFMNMQKNIKETLGYAEVAIMFTKKLRIDD